MDRASFPSHFSKTKNGFIWALVLLNLEFVFYFYFSLIVKHCWKSLILLETKIRTNILELKGARVFVDPIVKNYAKAKQIVSFFIGIKNWHLYTVLPIFQDYPKALSGLLQDVRLFVVAEMSKSRKKICRFLWCENSLQFILQQSAKEEGTEGTFYKQFWTHWFSSKQLSDVVEKLSKVSKSSFMPMT